MDYTRKIIAQLMVKLAKLKARLTPNQKKLPKSRFQENEAHYRIIAQVVTDALITIDLQSIIQIANPAVEKIFGYSPHQLIGTSITRLMPEYLRDLHRAGINRYYTTDRRHLNWQSVETVGLHQNGQEIALEISFGEFSHAGKPFFSSVIRDITERKRTEHYLALQHNVTTILTQNNSLEESSRLILKTIVENLTWQIGLLWRRDFSTNSLVYADSWAQPKSSLELAQFEKVSREITLTEGIGLPGRVWQTAATSWINDVTQDNNFVRSQAASAGGLHTAFAFPIIINSSVIGVMEFFTNHIYLADNELLRLFSGIGRQLGHFIERKTAEEKMALLERAVAASTCGIVITDPTQNDNPIIYVSPSFERLTGYSLQEAVGRNCRFLAGTDRIQTGLSQIRAALANYKECTVLLRNYRKDGSLFWNEVWISPVYNAQNQLVNYVGVQTDVTARKLAEEMLYRRQQEFKALVEKSPDIVARIDREGRNLYVNPTVEKITGVPPEFLLGKTADEAGLTMEQAKRWQVTLNKVLTTGEEEVFEYSFEAASGENKHLQSRLVPEVSEQGRIDSMLVVTRDITSLKQTELALAKERDFALQIMGSMGQGLTVSDKSGRFEFVNKAYAELLGYTPQELVGKTPFELILPEDYPILTSQLQKRQVGESSTYEMRVRKRDGSFLHVTITGVPLRQAGKVNGNIAVITDLTERQQAETMRLSLERKLLEAQKLESLGILAGGIAHDFNNILMAVVGNLGLIRLELAANSDATVLEELVTEAENGAYRARELTQQLLTFAKGGAPIKKLAALKPLLEEGVRFALRGKNTLYQLKLAEDLWLVEIDTGQVNQVIHNLILNAVQAMSPGGKITIEAENVVVESLDPNLGLKAGNYVRVVVQDEGEGIPAELIERIFEPYFTTKQQGSGLGLAASYSIIRQHHGAIAVSSEVGRGSRFSIYLPAQTNSSEQLSQSANATLVKQASENSQSAKTPAKLGRVLIVDDEATIRTVISRLLKSDGYDVTAVADGAVAVQEYARAQIEAKPFDIVIMDLTIIGGMGGKAATSALLLLNPNVKVIVASGYSNDPVMANYSEYGFSGAVGKPFKVEELRQVIANVLATKRL